MIDVIADGEAAQARRDAWEHLRAHAHVDVTLGPDMTPQERSAAVAALRRWWVENEKKLVPDPSGTFRIGS